MDVEEEAQRCAGDLLGAPHRPDLDQFARTGDVRHRHGASVDEELPGLGERDAEGLHDVSEGRRAVRGDGRASTPAVMGDEEPQFRGYFEGDLGSVHLVRMPSGGARQRGVSDGGARGDGCAGGGQRWAKAAGGTPTVAVKSLTRWAWSL